MLGIAHIVLNMAKLSDLVGVLGAHYVDAPRTLHVFARRLREAGRVTKAKRGFGAADMTHRDAARLLIACGATDHPERAAECEQFFSVNLPGTLTESDEALMEVHQRQLSLDEAVALLIEACPDMPNEDKSRLCLEICRSSGCATIYTRHGSLTFERPEIAGWFASTGLDQAEWRAAGEGASRYATGKNLKASFYYPLLNALALAVRSASA